MVEFNESDSKTERELKRQINAEDWIPVRRISDTECMARPVDRQDSINEGERITSNEWLIKGDGSTYTVPEEEFEEKFESSRTLVEKTYLMDLSWETDVESVTMKQESVVMLNALCDIATQTVVSFDVVDWSVDGDRVGDDGVPMELFEDHPDITERDR